MMLDNIEYKNKLAIKLSDKIYYDEVNNILYLTNSNDLANFIKYYSFSSLKILSSSLINTTVIKAIKENKRINFISLGSVNDIYDLSKEDFLILNEKDNLYEIETFSVTGKFNRKEREMLTFFKNTRVGNYSLNDIISESSFTFTTSLSDEEISYLKKYMKNNSTIYFNYNGYDNIILIIDSLKGRRNIFNINEYENIGEYFKSFKKLLNLKEKIYIVQSMNLDKYLYINKYLEDMVKDIKDSNLSLYEKYLAVYEIVTHFKEYLENKSNKPSARMLEYILFNDYIVCVGFSELLVALLEKVGIKALNVSVELYKEKEEITLEDEATLSYEDLKIKKGNILYHSKVIVRLVDDKYGINGIFVADPTWDNDLNKHYFNHSLLTFYETKLENNDYYETEASIFNVNNSNDFVRIINSIDKAIDFFIEVIKKVDYNFYKYLLDKYELDISNDMLLEIYNYIIKYTKKNISKDIKYNALKELFKFIYKDFDSNKFQYFFDGIIDDNNKRDGIVFLKGR